MMNGQLFNSPVRFGMKPPDDPSQEPECCKKRKLGIPVGCCPPLPPDQLIKSTDAVASKGLLSLNVITPPVCPAPETKASEQKQNAVVRFVTNVVNWVKEFVSNLWKDLKQVFSGKNEDTKA